MRISTQQIFSLGLNNLLSLQSQIARTQQQISSGKRIQTPADDPVASPQIQGVKEQLALVEQYKVNAAAAEKKLRLEETTLNSIKNAIQRVRELAVQGGNGAWGFAERQGIATEIRQRLQELVSGVNTTDASGNYLFSGFQSNVKPFVAQTGGGYLYQGDQGQLSLQVASNLTVAVSDPGSAVFTGIDDPLNVAITAGGGNGGTATVTNQAVTHQSDFETFFGGDSALVTFSVGPGGTTYRVSRVSDGATINGGNPPAPLIGIPYVPSEPIEFLGAHVAFSGTPADGDTFTVTAGAATKTDMLSVVEKLANGLSGLTDSPQDQALLDEVIADSLITLDQVIEQISHTEANIGARLNTIENANNTNVDLELVNKEILSNLEDLDYTQAISDLSQQSFVLEAAQSSFVRISNLSLFNFLR